MVYNSERSTLSPVQSTEPSAEPSDPGLCSSYPSCSGAVAPGLAADLHFQQNAIAFIGPACAFALEPVARLAAYWNTPIITGMGDQVGRGPTPCSGWLAGRSGAPFG